MGELLTARRRCKPWAWSEPDIRDMEWPVMGGYKIQYKDGSIAYYTEWEKIPNQIIKMQERGSYLGVTVTTWGPR